VGKHNLLFISLSATKITKNNNNYQNCSVGFEKGNYSISKDLTVSIINFLSFSYTWVFLRWNMEFSNFVMLQMERFWTQICTSVRVVELHISMYVEQ